MAFNLNNFVKDQTTSIQRVLNPTNVIDKVTPSQVRTLIKTDPKKFLDNRLGDLSGVKLGQIFKAEGAKYKETVLNTIKGMATALEAQIVGCINHAIRGILNRNPIIEKIVLFETFINRELSRIRNKLESKIDKELRKIAYKKLKIHQTVLFRQRMLKHIKKVCPGATPASPAEVRQYRKIIKDITTKNKDEGIETDNDENLPTTSVNNKVTGTPVTEQSASLAQDVSNKVKKASKEDPDEAERLKNEAVAAANSEIEKQAAKQIKGQNNQTWNDLMYS